MKCLMNGLEVNYPCSPACALFGDCVSAYMSEVKTESMTNGDRLRSLDDDHLVDILVSEPSELFCKNKPECGRLLITDKGIPDEWCRACALEWLESPADPTPALPLDHEEKADSGLVTED